MRKEQLIAIFLGSLIGVSAAFGLWRVSRGSSRVGSDITQTTQNAPTDEAGNPSVSNGFNIVSPNNNAVVGGDIVNIQGFANPNSLVVVLADETAVTPVTASGEFTAEAALTAGVNKVLVMSIPRGGTPEKQELTLVSTTKIDLSDPQKTATAIFGAVTDITADTLQIRTENGQIQLASMSTETTFASTLDNAREIEFSDLAIGDSVAALGFVNDEKIMEAGRVLVIKEPEVSAQEVIVGTVQTLSSRDFVVKTSVEGKEVSIDATGKVSVSRLADGELTTVRLSTAEEGTEIIIIGSYEADELVAESIILL